MASTNNSEFAHVLYERLNGYFSGSGLSKKANLTMSVKVIAGLTWWVISYFLLVMLARTRTEFAWLYFLHGTAHLFILLNIAHDANHHAISKRPWVNKFLTYSFDICGLNSYLWRILHHRNHHYCMNIHGEDETLFAGGFFRFSTDMPKKKFYRYQHIYVFFIYGFLILDWTFAKDPKYFFIIKATSEKELRHPIKEYLSLILTKLFFIAYMIYIPISVCRVSLWFGLLIFFLVEFLVGLVASFVVQIVHPIEGADFPASKSKYDHFVYHVLATTADFSAESPLANLMLGGLNLHVIHHLMPNVCHTHFPALTKIVKATANEFGVVYRENRTMYQAIVQHCKLLKKMGDPWLESRKVDLKLK